MLPRFSVRTQLRWHACMHVCIYIYHTLRIKLIDNDNLEECSSTDQVLSLLFRCHQFECHKSQDHWKLIKSLILDFEGLVDIHIRWQVIHNYKKKNFISKEGQRKPNKSKLFLKKKHQPSQDLTQVEFDLNSLRDLNIYWYVLVFVV